MDCLPKNECSREVAVRGDSTVVRREALHLRVPIVFFNPVIQTQIFAQSRNPGIIYGSRNSPRSFCFKIPNPVLA